MKTKNSKTKKESMPIPLKQNEVQLLPPSVKKQRAKKTKTESRMMPLPIRKHDEGILPPSVIIPSDD